MKALLVTAVSLLALPAFAQTSDHHEMSDSHTDHEHSHDHAGMDHADMDHGSMDHGSMSEAGSASALTLADQPELIAAVENGGTPVVATVLGAVCDFCATAMNKTFGKRDEVEAVYVDLDDKTLNLVLKAGAEMDDETLTSLVKKAGYKIDTIDRTPALPSKA